VEIPDKLLATGSLRLDSMCQEIVNCKEIYLDLQISTEVSTAYAALKIAVRHQNCLIVKQVVIATRLVTSLGHQTGRRVFWEGPTFFKLYPVVLNHVQHIFQGGEKFCKGGFAPPAPLLVTGLIAALWHSAKILRVRAGVRPTRTPDRPNAKGPQNDSRIDFINFPLQHPCLSNTTVPNRGFPHPWGSEARFLGMRNAIFEGESLCFLGCTFFKRAEIYGSVQVLLLKKTLSSPSIPAHVINLTILLNMCIAISANTMVSRLIWPVMGL